MEVSDQPHVQAGLTSGKEPPVPIRWEVRLAPEAMWTWCRKEKFPLPCRESNPYHPIVHTVTTRYTDSASRLMLIYYMIRNYVIKSRDISVGIALCYGLDD
jgi:hypothetical protein